MEDFFTGIDCSKYTVMIVDDIPINTLLIARMLQSTGLNIVQYNDSQVAFSRLEVDRPDIVLLDVMMPGMDGFTFLRLMRENSEFNQTKVVMVSALGTAEDQNKAKENGADGYLVKPVFMPRLLSSVAEFLRQMPKSE